tara:strand:+ start:6999 stop:7943 length:945 start_codon:yes stop_codon:yes gene_type:complete
MKDKISIIVPVYNVEIYLKRCINSLINQTYQNLEIILINDGSVDNSKCICEAFAKKDSRIVVLNQDNSGSSIARNSGLDTATGDVIAFVDSDDYIDNSMYEIMLQLMQEHNLDVVEIAQINSNETKKFDNKFVIENPVTASKRIIKNTLFSVWRRIYRKSVIDGMRFIPKIIHQDVFFTIDLLKRVSSIGYLNSALYIYNLENTSVIRSKYSMEKINTGIRATEYIIDNSINDLSLKKVVNDYIAFYYTDHYFLLSRNKHLDFDKTYRRKLKKEIFKAINVKNITIRSLLVILFPTKIMETISATNHFFKNRFN